MDRRLLIGGYRSLESIDSKLFLSLNLKTLF